MPNIKYFFIKKAVDFEMLRTRKMFINDVALAFSEPKKGIESMERQEKQMEQIYNLRRNGNRPVSHAAISWESDSDAAARLRRFQR
jgi:hypothetical protein